MNEPQRIDEPRSAAMLRAALVVAGALIAVQAALGGLGWLRAAPPVLACLAVVTALGAVTWRRRNRHVSAHARARPGSRPRWTALEGALAAALVALVLERLWSGLGSTGFLYDELSYHLHLPAAWRAAGRLFVVPTPFGDGAPAYAPANPELLYELGMALGGGVAIGHAGQAPFAALAALAIHACARGLGAPRAAGLAAALVFLMIPEIWRQAGSGMTDLALAAFFLAGLATVVALWRAPERRWRDVIAAGLALGLLLGTKYVALVLGAPLYVAGAAALARRRPGAPRAAAAALGGALVLASGGFWYLRNLALTGNPLFPLTVRVGSLVLAPGLYDGAAMRDWIYHLPIASPAALGEMLLDAGPAFLGAALFACFASRWRAGAALGALLVALVWLVVPYQQSRFLFPAYGVLAVVLATAAARTPRAGAAALVVALAATLLGATTPARLLAAAVAALTLALAALGAAAAARAPRASARVAGLSRRRGARAAVAALAAAVLLATVGARARSARPEYSVGDHHDAGWRFVRDHAPGQRIAYTGSNLPLPLWGPRLENDVRYVGVYPGRPAALHAYRGLSPPAPVTAEPAPYRAVEDRATWLGNLRAERIDLVFVAALYPIVAETIAHDGDGFPAERAFADAAPERFRLLFFNEGVRIYRHTAAAKSSAQR